MELASSTVRQHGPKGTHINVFYYIFISFISQINENIALRDKQPRREAIEVELRELETKQRQLEREGVAMEKKLRENNDGNNYSLLFLIFDDIFL